MKAFKWGIIGPGSIARDFSDDLKYVRRKQIVSAVLSHKKSSADEFAEEYNISSVHTNLEKFLAEKNFDAVYIASPHTAHYEQALQCLEHKVPVLCEKPLVINSRQVQDLNEASRKNKTLLVEGMWIRFLPSIKKLLDLVTDGKLGKIRSVKASMSYKAPRDSNNRYFDPTLGGGSLLDLGIYPVFLSQLLLGKPATIQAFAKLSKKGIDETCAVLMKYDEDQHAFAESSIITKTELAAEIAGDKGAVKILSPWNEKPEGIVFTPYGGKEKKYPCTWKGRGFQYEVEEFMHCLRNNQVESKQYTHQFSLDLMDTLDTIRNQVGVKYNAVE